MDDENDGSYYRNVDLKERRVKEEEEEEDGGQALNFTK